MVIVFPLTVTGTHDNLTVNNYKSYRRDGFLGVQDMSNSSFKNIYTEYDSSIFEGIATDFNNIRFVGKLNNVKFENVIIKDNAKVSKYYPLDATLGDNVTMDDVNIFVNELNTDKAGPFGISGSNNIISNSSLNIQSHTSDMEFTPVIYQFGDAELNGKNNNYDIVVNGWREIASNPEKESVRIILQNLANPNNNQARILDVSNHFQIEQINEIKTKKWFRKELVVLNQGNQQELDINIPNEFMIKSVNAKIIENTEPGILISLSTDINGSSNLITDLSISSNMLTENIDESTAKHSTRSLYLNANKNLNGKGKSRVCY